MKAREKFEDLTWWSWPLSRNGSKRKNTKTALGRQITCDSTSDRNVAYGCLRFPQPGHRRSALGTGSARRWGPPQHARRQPYSPQVMLPGNSIKWLLGRLNCGETRETEWLISFAKRFLKKLEMICQEISPDHFGQCLNAFFPLNRTDRDQQPADDFHLTTDIPPRQRRVLS